MFISNSNRSTTDHNQWKTNKNIENELKSRSIVFIDHLRYRTIHKYLVHEQLIELVKNFKKNSISKYLQKWIQFGIRIGESISSLTDLQLKSTVSNFENGQEFHCYGESENEDQKTPTF